MSFPSNRLFSVRYIIYVTSLSLLLVINANLIMRIMSRVTGVSVPPFFPISVFAFRIPSLGQILGALGLLAFFFGALKYLCKTDFRLSSVIIVGICLIVASNLLQGWRGGVLDPIDIGGVKGYEYYHQALEIKSASQFLASFERVQSDLMCHSRVHPPYATLLFYAFVRMGLSPALISMGMAVCATGFSLFFLQRILERNFQRSFASYISFLYVLIPAVQIYYLFSIEALVATFFLGAAYFLTHPKGFLSCVGISIFLLLSSLLTFLFIFFIPLFGILQFVNKRAIKRLTISVLLVGMVHLFLYFSTHFNYAYSFLTTCAIESHHAELYSKEFILYIFTRLESIAEILLFAGPFILVLCVRGITRLKDNKKVSRGFFIAGIVSFIIMMIAGVCGNGESARILIFMYAFLLLPVAVYLDKRKASGEEKMQVASLLFSQSVLMQLCGRYNW